MNIDKVKLVADFHKKVLARLRDELGAKFIRPLTGMEIVDPTNSNKSHELDFIVRSYDHPCEDIKTDDYTWVMCFPYDDKIDYGKDMSDEVYVAGSGIGLEIGSEYIGLACKILNQELVNHPGWYVPEGIFEVYDGKYDNNLSEYHWEIARGMLLYNVDYGFTSYRDAEF